MVNKVKGSPPHQVRLREGMTSNPLEHLAKVLLSEEKIRVLSNVTSKNFISFQIGILKWPIFTFSFLLSVLENITDLYLSKDSCNSFNSIQSDTNDKFRFSSSIVAFICILEDGIRRVYGSLQCIRAYSVQKRAQNP